ncbi:MAG: ferritin-like domain-containing protein, partial [Nannocystaceae bacterium]|nr:ferritin-like domain-containing protein [Nannocystaceae bacterium]
MEVAAFAERVLVGTTLADKLFAPSEFTDDAPMWRGRLPREPGRDPELALCTGRTPVTSLHVPEGAAERGALLHAFANHELLAIELLAQALLRFPDAPGAFRRGLVQTLREEQTHLQLYLDRMRTLGVEFGARPLSGFFWRAMSGVQTPSGFVAHLSLTFEQANLDFAEHYRRGFAAMGDHETAAVLQTVLDDEIGHVALGLRWFERWKAEDVSLFDAHRDALQGPLQIVRARGAGFEPEPRRRAGLPDSYIERLRTSGGSKGSAARVLWFNGAAEQEVEHGLRHTPRRSALAAVADLETVPMFFAAVSDVVLVRRRPRVAFLEQLGAAGFVLPRFEQAELERSPWPAPSALGALRELRPWATSPRASAFGATARVRIADPDKGAVWKDEVRPLYDKRFAVELAEQIAPDAAWTEPHLGSRVVRSLHDLERARREFESLGYSMRVKPPFGAAGRGHRVHCGDADDVVFVEALLRRAGGVVVEPEFEVVAQFSIRLLVQEAGASVLGIGRCGSTAAGQFVYAAIGAAD